MKTKFWLALAASGGIAFGQDVDLGGVEKALQQLDSSGWQKQLDGSRMALEKLQAQMAFMGDSHFEALDFSGNAFLGNDFFPQGGDDSGETRSYSRGVRSLDKNQYEDAIRNFDAEIAAKGPRADGAMYWKAYAENQLGRRGEALKTIAELRRQFANSRWLNDAKALELEVRAQEGKPVNPGAESDDELKLMALNSLMQSDPNKAIPVLKRLLNSSQSPAIKDKAMFVLSQAGSADARQVLAEQAHSGNPDVQASAIRYLAMIGSDWSRTELANEYRASNDPHIKREILQGFMISGAKDKLLDLARSEKDPELRKQAINTLAQTGGKEELWTLYQSEQNADLRRQIVQSMLLDGDSAHLLTIAKTDRDPAIRKQAINTLALTGWGKDSGEMANLYRSETDPQLKREVINGLFLEGNAKVLVELARQEKDPELKRDMISHLALIHSKESTDYMMEILK
jgi:HEAT repeat protein